MKRHSLEEQIEWLRQENIFIGPVYRYTMLGTFVGYYDTYDGKLIVPFIYQYGDMFENGLARVQNKAGLYGWIDMTGYEVIPCIYQFADCFSEFFNNHALVKKDGLYGVIDTEGNTIIPFGYYEEFAPFYISKYWIVKRHGLWGVIDSCGKVIIPCEYDEIELDRRCAHVKKDGKSFDIEIEGFGNNLTLPTDAINK